MVLLCRSLIKTASKKGTEKLMATSSGRIVVVLQSAVIPDGSIL